MADQQEHSVTTACYGEVWVCRECCVSVTAMEAAAEQVNGESSREAAIRLMHETASQGRQERPAE